MAALALEGFYTLGWKVTGRGPVVTRENIQFMTTDRHYSIARAQDELGYAPRYDYPSGIDQFIRGLRQDGFCGKDKHEDHRLQHRDRNQL